MGTKRDAASRKRAVDELVAKLGTRCCTMLELFEQAGVPLDRPTAASLSRSAAVLARNVAAIPRLELESVHVAPRDAVEAALQRDDVLVGILRRLAITGKTRAHTVTDLAKTVSSRDQAVFAAVLRARVKDRRWPEGVGAVVARRNVLVFLLEDLVTGAPRPAAPDRTDCADGAFAAAFDRVFEQLRRERGLNLVELSALRAALAEYPREAFDRELFELRRANRVVLHTFDGRHGKLRPEEVAAAIEEGGRRFVYAARREA